MAALLFLAFLVFPLVELWAIIQVGQAIGVWWTILLLAVDSIVGAWLVKHEGRRAWTAFREALAAGRWPADEVAQGALVLIGGALLMTPGFVTDIFGLAFVIPPTRALLAKLIRSRFAAGSVRVVGTGPRPAGQHGTRRTPPQRSSGQSSREHDPSATGRTRASRETPNEVLDVEVISVERLSEPKVERLSEPKAERDD